MKRCLVVVVALVLAAGCRKNADHPSSAGTSAPTPGSASGPGGVPMPPPLPEGHQCLPAVICTDWVGCALVAADKVVSADRLAPGQAVTIANECSGGKHCVAARALPAGVECPPSEIPAVIDPPPYTCVYDGKTCGKR
jgi:hypothetical protein